MNIDVLQEKWWDLGQHEYRVYAQAKQKHLQMRDNGHKSRILTRNRVDGEWFIVQVFCA
ncbi:hypothetical protein UFOVP393_61 [uncultured Caudovirales phage]|uniref:Uncharacterized protein n=1 Tax=uncultured Caudovirales phage TaxID=2100421 RepID=A0A6J7XAL2_9CAUD|nr:hypothetical protein UFOVP393_61 [uncultured Caudovirales phage]